jgi:hypothetical protein
MPIANQGACQSRETAKNRLASGTLAYFANQELVANPKRRSGTFANRGASNLQAIREECQ